MYGKIIDRPVLAIVISLLIAFLGLLSLRKLPMAQFPSIAPPEVNVTIEYTGANAETVVKAALIKIERAINGVQGMKYMSSDAGNDGVGVVQVIFELGTDPDVASVNVQNRVASVMGELPEEVIRNGVKIAKEENAMLMYLNLYSTDRTMEEKFIYNFTTINVLPELKRINGIGYAQMLGAKEYAMRIWLKPDKLLAYRLSPEDVIEALQAQNVEAAPGKIGESSDKKSQDLQYVIRYAGKFQKEDDYRNIAIRANPDGEILRVRDVADVEFGTIYFDVESKLNGKPSAALMLKQLPGSNASEVIAKVKEQMKTLKTKAFLPGMDYEISYDVSRFLDASIHEVVKTLIEAFILVALVVFLFLQDFRSTLVPTLAVPVSLIGTFFFMSLFGFSLNLITLFALVLAIGIVIDNAIVVVEAVHTRLEKGNVGVYEATRLAMNDIGAAIVAITLVMSAVFVPTSFMEGPSGVFFKQFSLTMAISIVLSGVSALTLTPALCVLLLKPHTAAHSQGWLNGFFVRFNAGYQALADRYGSWVTWLMHRRLVTVLMLVLFSIGTGLLGKMLPAGFIPNEDQGSFYISVTTPPGATLERTKAIINSIQKSCQDMPAISSISTLAGTNILSDGTGATYGTCLVNLKPWSEREQTVDQVMEDVQNRVKVLKDCMIEVFPPPAVPGYGNASGFELRLLDKTGQGDNARMQEVVGNFISDLKARPEIASAFTIFEAGFPQYEVVVDQDRAAQKGVRIQDVMSTLQTYLGSEYATNFVRFGQMYKVMVQALPQMRAKPADLLGLYVKNEAGEMVPVSAFARLERKYGVDQVTRYNMFPSAEMNGEAAEGFSSGEALKAVQETAETKLPQGFDIDWAGISRDELSTGNQTLYIFLVCLVFVYLLLAAQYESFLLPVPILVVLPAGLIGSFGLLALMGLENNIYAQIAVVMLIGLLGKNGILMVEFAIQEQKNGHTPFQAALAGAISRLRPILMTSFAFIAGLMPLLGASGAGAVGNKTIGAAAAGGMISGTLIGILFVPVLYLVFARSRSHAATGSGGSVGKVLVSMLLCVGFLGMNSCKLPDSQVQVKRLPAVPATGADSAWLPPDWRSYFPEARFQALADSMFASQPDWLAMHQQLEMAKAEVQRLQGARLPFVSAGGGAAIRKFGLYTMDGAGNATTDILPGKVVPEHLPDYFPGFNASWEADIWGRLKKEKLAGQGRFLAAVETRKWLATSLLADLGLTWYSYQALKSEKEILRRNIELQKAALGIVKSQKQVGMVTELPVKQFEAQLAGSRARAAETDQLLVEQQNMLKRLLGRFDMADDTSSALPDTLRTLPVWNANLAVLLAARPDVRQMERQVEASRLDLEAARLLFYPRFSLQAGLGVQAFRPDKLLAFPQSLAYQSVGSLFGPLVNRSAIHSAFKQAKASHIDLLYQYQRSIVNAWLEVKDHAAGIEHHRKAFGFRKEEVAALEKATEVALQLYKTGQTTYLEVLLVQQNSLEAELNMLATWRSWMSEQILLFKSVGGGSNR